MAKDRSEIGGTSTPHPNNEDGSVEITSFSDIGESITLHFQIIRLPKQIYAWIGYNSTKLGHLHAAASTRPNNTVSVTPIFGGTSDNTGSSIARRLVLRTGLNIILACNIPKNNPMIEATAEKKLLEKLISLGYTKPKTCKIENLGQEFGKSCNLDTMKVEELNRCQIQEWYPNFKSVSLKTIIHQLPEPFVQYLLDDSGTFLLPISVTSEDAFPNRVHEPEDEEDFQVLEGSDDESEEAPAPPTFPELELLIKGSIESLGGAVFPKLNWSSPKDAAWISSTTTLKCTSFSEIALLLRASDSVVHDLCHAYDSCSDKTSSRPNSFYIALRKWAPSLSPDREFRCFVHRQRLIGASQREVTTFYPTLLESKPELEDLISDFFLNHVKGRFASENFTFDIYVTRQGKVKLIDFNPWGVFTLPLMFTWEELEEIARKEGDVGVEFRVVESRCGVRPGLKTAVPIDYLDMSAGSGWDEVFRKAEELKHQTGSSEHQA